MFVKQWNRNESSYKVQQDKIILVKYFKDLGIVLIHLSSVYIRMKFSHWNTSVSSSM